MDIESLVQSQAKQAGFSSKQTKQALKKLREGGLMAQIAPMLQEKMSDMNPNMTPRERLRMKLNNSYMARASKETKAAAYEKQREDAHRREAEAEEAKLKAKDAAKRRQQVQKQKLKDLEKKIGQVTEEMYLNCLTRQKAGEYKDEGDRNRDRNIIDLYMKQQQFAESINMEDLDLDDL